MILFMLFMQCYTKWMNNVIQHVGCQLVGYTCLQPFGFILAALLDHSCDLLVLEWASSSSCSNSNIRIVVIHRVHCISAVAHSSNKFANCARKKFCKRGITFINKPSSFATCSSLVHEGGEIIQIHLDTVSRNIAFAAGIYLLQINVHRLAD